MNRAVPSPTIEVGERKVEQLQVRLSNLATERGALEGSLAAATRKVAGLDARRGPLVRSGDQTAVSALLAERDAANQESANAEAGLTAIAAEEAAVTAELREADEALTRVRHRALARELLTEAERFDGALATAGQAYGEIMQRGDALGLGHTLANSILTGGLLWGAAPQLARSTGVSGRSAGRSLAGLLREVLGHHVKEKDV